MANLKNVIDGYFNLFKKALNFEIHNIKNKGINNWNTLKYRIELVADDNIDFRIEKDTVFFWSYHVTITAKCKNVKDENYYKFLYRKYFRFSKTGKKINRLFKCIEDNKDYILAKDLADVLNRKIGMVKY